jgi:hypothetical protein
MSVLAFVRTPDAKPITPESDDPSTPMSLKSLTDFTNAAATVWTYSHTVTQTNLGPVDPKNPPTWYAELNSNLSAMKTHAQSWLDTTGPSMTNIPQAIVNFDNKFEGQYATIIDLLNAIGGGTPTAQQKTDLLEVMNSLLSELTGQGEVINEANKALIGFNDNLTSDHTALTTGAASVTNAITADKDDVIKQNGRVKNLQADMATWQAVATAAEVAIGLSFFAAAIGLWMTIATFGAGALVLAGGIVGLAASVGTTIAANVKIAQDASAILDAQNDISDDNKQVVILNTVASTVDGLMEQNATASKAMMVIMSDWGTLMTKMKSVIDDLDAAEGDIGSILDVGDMKTTKLAWTQLTSFADKMQSAIESIAAVTPVALGKPA